MRRLGALVLVLLLVPMTGMSDRAATPAPTDVERMNSFAQAYNLYAEQLKNGVVDLKQWERVRRAWERLQ